MSVEAISWALNLDDPTLTATDRLVLIGIANHDGDGGAWPSVSTLARYAGTTNRTVQKAVTRLVDAGYVTRHLQQGGTTRTPDGMRPNLYELHRTPPVPSDTPPPVPSDTPGVSVATPEPSTNRPVEPETNISDQPSSVATRIPFDSFWKQYPRKEGKATAEGRWSKMSDLHRQEAMDALPVWCAYYATIDPKFIPHSSTWLNQRRWEDDPPDTPDTVTAPAPARTVGCETCDGTGWVETPDPTLRSGVGMARCDCQTLTNPEQTDI